MNNEKIIVSFVDQHNHEPPEIARASNGEIILLGKRHNQNRNY